MNAKKAKRLRREAFEKSTYETQYSDETPVMWGPLPRNKKTEKVDAKKFAKVSKGDKNIKFKTITTKNKFGQEVTEKLYRYIHGIPIKMISGFRYQYKLLKNNVEVAQSAN